MDVPGFAWNRFAIGLTAVAIVFAAWASPAAIAQVAAPAPSPSADAPSPAVPGFEVVSIKPHPADPGTPGRASIGAQPGGRFAATQVTVRDLIKLAYGAPMLDDARVVGGPAWAASERFDIEGRAPDGPPQQLQAMLRTLLAERFGLVLRNERRDAPVYALMLATPDGRLGPRLQRSEDCTVSGNRKGPGATDDPAAMCGGGGTQGRLAFGGIPLAVALLPALSREVQRIVVDRTGLTGYFDGALEWSPIALALAAPPADRPSPDGAPLQIPSAQLDAPSIFTALQEQFGLKLVPATAPIDVFVIEAVSRPTAN